MKLVTFGRTVVFVALSAFAFEALAEVSGDSAVVSLIQNGKETPYRSLEALLADCTNEATIVVHADCALPRRVTVTKSLTVVGVGSGRTVSAPGLTDFGFWVDSGTLTFSNITFSAYAGKGLVVVDGADATFVLAKGARLDGLRGLETDDYYSDAITVQAGTATLLSGCEISGCSCYAGNWGGAVLVKEGGRLNLWGGTVTNCFATFGGGVNVEEGGVVSVKGDVRVSGNRAKPRNVEIASDIYVNYDSNPETAIKLDGAVTSADRSIGIHCCNSSANAEGASFASAGESFPESEATSTAAKFFCDATAGEDPSLIGAAAPDGRTLKWAMTEDPIVPEEAVIRVITGGGAVTNSYGSASQAFANLSVDAVVEVLANCSFQEDLTVGTAIVLRSVKGMGLFREMTRNGDCSVVVKSGGRLTISGLTVNGGNLPCRKALIRVDGGAMSLESGAEVKNAICETGDCGGAGILVDKGGSLTMSAGAAISGCSCTGEMSEGAGIWATGADIDLGGGTISDCKADHSAAVSLHDCRSLKIGDVTFSAIQSGDRVSASYTCYGDGCSEVELAGRLQLEGEGGFLIDVDQGGDCFGFVNADCLTETEVESLACSAGIFFRTEGKSASSGCVVTNADEALLVWASAVKDGLYEDEAGNRYFEVKKDVPPAPVAVDPDPIGFASVAQEADGTWTLVVTNRRAWANYRLIWTDDLARGFTTTGAWEQATSDGTWTTNVSTSGNAVFWRAEGKQGEVPREL